MEFSGPWPTPSSMRIGMCLMRFDVRMRRCNLVQRRDKIGTMGTRGDIRWITFQSCTDVEPFGEHIAIEIEDLDSGDIGTRMVGGQGYQSIVTHFDTLEARHEGGDFLHLLPCHEGIIEL